MAAKVSYAVAEGNWSNTATWFGGALPTAGDTVYANGFTVTIDQHVDLTTGIATVAGNALVVGCRYVITTVGDATFTSYGAAANTVGTIFIAITTGGGTTGVVTPIATLTTSVLAASSIVVGGVFLMTGSYNLTLDVVGATANSATHAVLVLGGLYATDTVYSSLSCTVTGNVWGGGGSNMNAIISFASGGTLTVVGNVTGMAGNTGCPIIIYIASNQSLVVIGNVTGGTATSAYAVLHYGSDGCSITVTGNVTGGTGNTAIGIYSIYDTDVFVTGNVTGAASGTAGNGIRIDGAANCIVTGNVTGGGGTAAAIHMSSNTSIFVTVIGNVTAGTAYYGILCSGSYGKVTVLGDVWASAASSAILNGLVSNPSTNPVIISGSTYDVSGYCAVVSQRQQYSARPTAAVRRVTLNEATPTYLTLYTADSGLTDAQASPENVRQGVSYASGNLTGTMVIPAVTVTELGVSVDGGTGTAIITLGSLRKILTSVG